MPEPCETELDKNTTCSHARCNTCYDLNCLNQRVQYCNKDKYPRSKQIQEHRAKAEEQKTQTTDTESETASKMTPEGTPEIASTTSTSNTACGYWLVSDYPPQFSDGDDSSSESARVCEDEMAGRNSKSLRVVL